MTTSTNNQQQLLEYAEWQKVEDEYGHSYVVYQAGPDDYYYVVQLDEYLISTVIGPDKHDREIVDLDDPHQLCFVCHSCHWGNESTFDACSTFREIKPGVSEQVRHLLEYTSVDDRGEDYYASYHENTIPEVCRHARALITVLKRRRDLNNIGGEEGVAEEYDTDGWVITFATSERRPQKERVKGDIIR